MPFEQIETKKREITDKYVVVDASRPELARFKDAVGRVKTVNMSGRALVEFDDYHLNTGWYDIDPEFLKVVDKPPAKVEKPAAKKPTAKAEAKPASAAAPAKPTAAAAAAKAGKPSVADILAAARGGKTGGATSPAPAAAKAKPSEAAPAAPKPEPAAKPAVDRSKMSVAEMIAAARAGGSTAAPAAKPPTAAPPVEAAAVQEEAPADEPVVEPTPAAPAAKPTEKVDKSKMTIADMIAWCRQRDAK